MGQRPGVAVRPLRRQPIEQHMCHRDTLLALNVILVRGGCDGVIARRVLQW